MIRIEFLCISSFQPYRSSYSKSQAGGVFGDHDYTMVKNTVLVSHDGIITEKFPDSYSSKYTDFTIQKISKTPTLSENEIISCSLIRESFGNTNLLREITGVVANSRRTTTRSWYESVLRRWFAYAASRNTDPCTPDVNRVLSLMHGMYMYAVHCLVSYDQRLYKAITTLFYLWLLKRYVK